MIHEYRNTLLLRRHKIKLFYIIGKSLIYLIISLFVIILLFFLFGSSNMPIAFNENIFLIFLISINLIVIILILDIISHFNNLIYINDTQIYIIQSWLFLREDIEIIDLNKVTKVNILCQGLIPNMCSYGKIIIEQQRTQTRPLFYIPEPYRVLSNIRGKIEKLQSIGSQGNNKGIEFDANKIFGKI